MFGKKLAMGKVAPSTKEKTKKTLSAHPTSFKIEVSIYTHTSTGVLGAESELKMSH
jgi:hypothetical protein